MIIEVSGVNFVNKGAELMLHAIVQQTAVWQEPPKLALDLRSGNFKQRQGLGLYHLAWADSDKMPLLGPLLNHFARLWPAGLRTQWGWIPTTESNAILDAAGFAHSDQLGSLYSTLLLRRYRRAKADGKKIVLLPQAFGPFTNVQVASVVREMIDLADIVYARDQMSYEHLVGLNGRSTHIKIAPDFTNLVIGPPLTDMPQIKNQPCIIPNYRMIEKTEPAVQANYLSFLVTIIKMLQSAGFSPFLLIHETQSDLPLAQLIQTKLDKALPIVQETNALRIKSIIGQACIVIASRYHGLISGLSQGVPCLATGWSHKYQMLLADYGCPQCLVSPLTPESEILDQIHAMITEPSRAMLIANLNTASNQLKDATKKMWGEVHHLLYNRSSAL